MTRQDNMKDFIVSKVLTRKIFDKQTQSSKVRGHQKQAYTRDELEAWIKEQDNFDELFYNWVDSGFSKFEVPSVDRLRDDEGYSFGNIQLVSWRENLNNRNLADSVPARRIKQLDLDENEIEIFESSREASRKTGTNNGAIWKCCVGKLRTSNGFKWQYE